MIRTPEQVKTFTRYCRHCKDKTEQYRIPGIGIVCDNCLMNPGEDEKPSKPGEQIEMFSA